MASSQLCASLPTSIMDFRGFDPSIILILRGGILMSMGDFPESLSQAILVGIMLVGTLGVCASLREASAEHGAHEQPRPAIHTYIYIYIYICIYAYVHTNIYIINCQLTVSSYIYLIMCVM